MLLVVISSLYYTTKVLFFICLLEGLGIILILILIFFLPWFIHSNFYLLFLKLGFFQYPILHKTFQALIEGYSSSRSYINFSSNEFNEPHRLTHVVYYFSQGDLPEAQVHKFFITSTVTSTAIAPYFDTHFLLWPHNAHGHNQRMLFCLLYIL